MFARSDCLDGNRTEITNYDPLDATHVSELRFRWVGVTAAYVGT